MEIVSLVFCGHVDHGKSTVVGRLLAECGALPDGKLEQVRAECEANSKPFEYAFLTDALEDERSQGITIDSARIFFKGKKRNYLIIDAPGHIEFVKNMVSGASACDGAFLVIAADEGVRENSQRHAYLLSVLGIEDVTVLVNKMDLAGYKKSKYEKIKESFSNFLKSIGIENGRFIPLSGFEGDNVVFHSSKMKWYKGPTLLNVMESLKKRPKPVTFPFRMPVQDVYKFTKFGDKRRVIAGRVLSGEIEEGEEVIFMPSRKKGKIKKIEVFNEPRKNKIKAGDSAALTLEDETYIRRGEVMLRYSDSSICVSPIVKANIFWMGKEPFCLAKEYVVKIGTQRKTARAIRFDKVMDTAALKIMKDRDFVGEYEAAEVLLEFESEIAFDTYNFIPENGRFVIIDDYAIKGGGIIKEVAAGEDTDIVDKVIKRNYHWIMSSISGERRAFSYGHKPLLVVISGKKESGRKRLAMQLEEKLFADGKKVYFLGMGNIVYGINADIAGKSFAGKEHIRRLTEVSNILLDAGHILIVTALELGKKDFSIIERALSKYDMKTIWLGNRRETDYNYGIFIGKKSGNIFEKAWEYITSEMPGSRPGTGIRE